MGSKIELWFVRHGESKNNAILNAAGGLGAVMYPLKFSQDPHITQKGKDVAKENGERLVEAGAEFDLVMSSCMVRTIETTYYMFIKSGLIDRIYVAPYISEVPLRWGGLPIYENIPLKREKQIRNLGRAHGSDLLDRLDFSLIGGPKGKNKETLPPNGDNFLAWLYSQEIVQDLVKNSGKEKIRIGVVTHSHFLMKKDTLHLDKKPSNADIWTANLHAMPVEGEDKPILSLTDLKGWYQEKIADIGKRLDHKIEKAEKKSAKKTEKYNAKIEKLGLKNGTEGSSDENAEQDGEQEHEEDNEDGEAPQETLSSEDLEKKKKKKEEKYKEKIAKKQHRYSKKKEKYAQRKENFVNQSDLEIAARKQQQQQEQGQQEGEE